MFEGLRFRHWHPSLDSDGFLTLGLDQAGSSANALGKAVLEELAQILERITIEPPRGVIIRSLKQDSFIVGADIKEFKDFAEQNRTVEAIQRGHSVFDRLADLTCPTVAAIHGACLGGGTELALACRFRVATSVPRTKIGLPEVLLGIHPGWGGSARLPYLIGAKQALDLLLTGKSLSAGKALKAGLVDALAKEDELVETAKKTLLRKPPRRVLRYAAWLSNRWPVRRILAYLIKKRLTPRVDRKHYPAPYALLDMWLQSGGSVHRLLRAEIKSVARLAKTPTAANLIRVFFLQERLKSLGNKSSRDIERVHVIGAGTMGSEIAAWCALQGFETYLQDREQALIDRGLANARQLFEKRAKDPALRAQAAHRLSADLNGDHLPQADLVIEAIYENLQAKRELFANIEPRLKPTAVLATNTSSIPLAALAQDSPRKDRFLGLHFFNPVAMMPLVEVVEHDALTANARQQAIDFVRGIDKLPLPVASSPGFLVNRILTPYLLEAARLHAEGVPAPMIDKAAKRFGMPVGPIELVDTVGLDVALAVADYLATTLHIDIPAHLPALAVQGRRGKKDGQGFYIWREGKPVKAPVPASSAAPPDLEDRLILIMLNEAVACLHEKVVASAELLDAGAVFGMGFAPFRGGPMQYIEDNGGKTAFKAKLARLSERYGARFAPKAGWDD